MKNRRHTLRLKNSELGTTKVALEYLFMNVEKAHLCITHQKELANLLNKVTQMVDGKSLYEQIDESKKGGDKNENNNRSK